MTKNSRRHFLVFCLCLSLCFSLLPQLTGQGRALALAEFGLVTKTSVKVRMEPSSSALYQSERLNTGDVVAIKDFVFNANEHASYFAVNYTVTNSAGNQVSRSGYIIDTCMAEMTPEQVAAYKATGSAGSSASNTTTANSAGTVSAGSGATGSVTSSGTNLREGPGTNYKALTKLDRGTVVDLLEIPTTIDSNHWYKIRYNGIEGYMMSTYIQVLSNGSGTGSSSGTAAPVTPVTPVTPSTPATNDTSYVKTTVTSVNVRKTPNGTKYAQISAVGTVLPISGPEESAGGYKWIKVKYDGRDVYVRSDLVIYCNKDGGTNASSNTTNPTTPAERLYVTTLASNVQLYKTASTGEAAEKLANANTVMVYQYAASDANWLAVVYNKQTRWVQAKDVRMVYAGEYDLYIANGGTPATTLDNTTPSTPSAPSSSTGYVVTTSSGVNIRKEPGGATMGRVNKGVILSFSSSTKKNNVTWYYVYTSYGWGYIHGNYVQTCLADGTPHDYTTPGTGETPSVTPGGGTTGTPSEAAYTTLRKGSTGTAVKNLVTALKNQGYYSGSITSTYTSSVVSAVKAFQKAKGLTADGVAGAKTQHALYGTVPEGSTDASNLTMAIYPAEKIDWYTGGIQQLWPKGSNYKIYDVKTGIVWWAHRWSGGLHVDAEPLTAADTNRLCRIYGVSSAQQIADKNLYERRPCLVTIGNRTFACSLYGVPHNYPEGDTIDNNEFRGQLCIHFTNSKTHASNKVDSGHVEAIQYAIDHAPNGHK